MNIFIGMLINLAYLHFDHNAELLGKSNCMGMVNSFKFDTTTFFRKRFA